ncbi:MAG: GMC family oxidoreductase [Hahellaceae bacterium]|nr:GMC family oxidoreductase [Hahellaceae bacterium]
MLLDANSPDVGETLTADVCIVGAGAAGISIARALIGSHLKVVLLESGGLEFETESQSLNKGGIQGRYYYDLDVGRLRFFGGTTNHWSGWSRPLDEIDFEKRESIPLSGWPISHQELEPYYRAAQQVCELGDFAYTGVENQQNLPAFFHKNHPHPKTVTRVWKRSPPTRFGTVYRDELTQTTNVDVYYHANVVDLITDPATQTVTQVNVLTLSGKTLTIQAKQVVLAAGGIEVPRLLLSANGGKGIGNSHDQVGRYFMLHPQVDVGRLMLDASSATQIHTEPAGIKPIYRGGLSLDESVQRQKGLPNHAVLFTVERATRFDGLKRMLKQIKSGEDLETHIQALIGDLGGAPPSTEAGQDFVDFILHVRLDHLPNPDSRLRLSDKMDTFGVPQIEMDWKLSHQDFTSLKQTMLIIAEALGELGMGRVQLKSWLLSDEEHWPEDSEWDFHHMGATRMSADPKTGVVDADCRVHGTENLYVASSSVFSTAGFSNPTLTIVALALRLADHLKAVQV